MNRRTRWIAFLLGGVVVLAVVARLGLPYLAERSLNRSTLSPPYRVGAEARRLHEKSLVADLHADTLLWDRDLLKRASYGHVDLPRLRDGGIGLQVFGVVTKVPRGLNFRENAGDSDMITWLAVFQGWPIRSWASLMERALFQGDKLQSVVRRSNGALTWIRDRDDLEDLVRARAEGRQVIGAVLAIEGMHAIEGDLTNIDRLHDRGFRMIGLSHFFDNAMAGSAHGVERYGLTPSGRDLVRRSQELGMVIDVAHASPRALDDVLALTGRPVVVSHTGVRGTCDSPRNLSDDHLRGIAETGGVVGIGLFSATVCGDGVEDTVAAMRYAVERVGVDHVAVGSDFDGAARTHVQANGMPLLTEALINGGFSEDDIAAILGGNVVRVLRETLPR